MPLETNTIYLKYANKPINEILPGHVRADMALMKGTEIADHDVAEYLMNLLSVVKEFWKGRWVSLRFLYDTFSDLAAVITVTQGAGTISTVGTGESITYTEDATPVGQASVVFVPPAYHSFRIGECRSRLSDQDAALTVTLRIYEDDQSRVMYEIFSESMDNSGRSRREEGTDYRDPRIGEHNALKLNCPEMDASSTLELLVFVEVL